LTLLTYFCVCSDLWKIESGDCWCIKKGEGNVKIPYTRFNLIDRGCDSVETSWNYYYFLKTAV
jgi:hypothetical protein